MINIGNNREVFFDDFIVNEELTTAEKKLNKPHRRDVAISFDKPWEGAGCGYMNIFFADGKWKLYYRCGNVENASIGIGYAESLDGIHWVRPNLGIVEFGGSKDNNLIADDKILRDLNCIHLNDAFVFYDDNPLCPVDEKYKMILSDGNKGLASLLSPDGIHFRFCQVITTNGAFDSQNLAFFDKEKGKYICYYRGKQKPSPGTTFEETSYDKPIMDTLYDPETISHHPPMHGEEGYLRDIRVIESSDFRTWTENVPIIMKDDRTQLYTNVVSKYPRVPGLYVAFPTRYVERKSWTPNYDELCGKKARLQRIRDELPREGLALTDCLFMCSRDGYNFTRYDESIIPPPVENPYSWVYGDCYAAHGIVETQSDIPGADKEYSFYVTEYYRSDTGKCYLARYTSRIDGFVSRHAGGDERLLVTKEFLYEGEALYANIATSARGGAYFTLKSEGVSYESYEIFGNSIDKRIHFLDDSAVTKLSGKPVTLEIRMMDCDVYAIRFGK